MSSYIGKPSFGSGVPIAPILTEAPAGYHYWQAFSAGENPKILWGPAAYDGGPRQITQTTREEDYLGHPKTIKVVKDTLGKIVKTTIWRIYDATKGIIHTTKTETWTPRGREFHYKEELPDGRYRSKSPSGRSRSKSPSGETRERNNGRVTTTWT